VWGVSTSAAGLDARMLQVTKLVLTKRVSLVVRPDALVSKLVSLLVRRSSIECTGAPRLQWNVLVPHVYWCPTSSMEYIIVPPGLSSGPERTRTEAARVPRPRAA
jgi:hypothetical protein